MYVPSQGSSMCSSFSAFLLITWLFKTVVDRLLSKGYRSCTHPKSRGYDVIPLCLPYHYLQAVSDDIYEHVISLSLFSSHFLQACHTNYRVRGAPVRSLKTSFITTVDLWPDTGRFHQLRRCRPKSRGADKTSLSTLAVDGLLSRFLCTRLARHTLNVYSFGGHDRGFFRLCQAMFGFVKPSVTLCCNVRSRLLLQPHAFASRLVFAIFFSVAALFSLPHPPNRQGTCRASGAPSSATDGTRLTKCHSKKAACTSSEFGVPTFFPCGSVQRLISRFCADHACRPTKTPRIVLFFSSPRDGTRYIIVVASGDNMPVLFGTTSRWARRFFSRHLFCGTIGTSNIRQQLNASFYI